MPEEQRQQQHVAPRSGRGTQLTSSQEATLIHICNSNRGEDRLSDHTKSFWKALSAELLQKTGRGYSWQSCRRRMVAWELSQLYHEGLDDDRLGGSVEHVLPGPQGGLSHGTEGLRESAGRGEVPSGDKDDDRAVGRPQGPLSRERDDTQRSLNRALRWGPSVSRQENPVNAFEHAAPDNRRVASNNTHHQTQHTPTLDESTEDDEGLLPETPVPLLQRNIHARCEREKKALRGEILPMFLNGLSAFEAQIRCFASTMIQDEEDRAGVLEAFGDLKGRINLAIGLQGESMDTSRR